VEAPAAAYRVFIFGDIGVAECDVVEDSWSVFGRCDWVLVSIEEVWVLSHKVAKGAVSMDNFTQFMSMLTKKNEPESKDCGQGNKESGTRGGHLVSM
jgi:hypothetical protein